jgi:hypothetical protein
MMRTLFISERTSHNLLHGACIRAKAGWWAIGDGEEAGPFETEEEEIEAGERLCGCKFPYWE